MSSKYIALICARGGSKGLPGKNIRLLNGTPLIGHSINIAKRINRISRIIVSTDSEEIAKVAIKFGAEVPFMRPKKLAQDDSPEWLVWRHAVKYLEDEKKSKINNIVILPPTAPLRDVEDINNCIDEFKKNKVDSVITVCNAHRSPYFNMISSNDDGYASLVVDSRKKITRRQDSPKVFDVTTVAYVINTEFIKTSNGIFDGKVRSVLIPKERAIDIDTLLDFKMAECLMNNE